jgi:hypothetical protein
MIYAQLWDYKTLDSNSSYMHSPIERSCTTHPNQVPLACRAYSTIADPMADESRVCMWHKARPFFIRPVYVGIDSAREIVEAWHKAVPQGPQGKSRFEYSLKGAYRAVTRDSFYVQLNPATVLRALNLKLDLTPFVLTDKDEDILQREKHIATLLRIKRKTHFRLHIVLQQVGIRLNLWSAAMELFRPVIETFEREGACVNVKFRYRNHSWRDVIEFDMMPTLKNPDSDWRAQAVAYFTNVSFV